MYRNAAKYYQLEMYVYRKFRIFRENNPLSSWNDGTTMPFSDSGNSCSSREFLTSQMSRNMWFPTMWHFDKKA